MNPMQITAASILAARVVHGNASNEEMDYIRWYASLPIEAVSDEEIGAASELFYSDVSAKVPIADQMRVWFGKRSE